jgi:hypothetical protein
MVFFMNDCPSQKRVCRNQHPISIGNASTSIEILEQVPDQDHFFYLSIWTGNS